MLGVQLWLAISAPPTATAASKGSTSVATKRTQNGAGNAEEQRGLANDAAGKIALTRATAELQGVDAMNTSSNEENPVNLSAANVVIGNPAQKEILNHRLELQAQFNTMGAFEYLKFHNIDIEIIKNILFAGIVHSSTLQH